MKGCFERCEKRVKSEGTLKCKGFPSLSQKEYCNCMDNIMKKIIGELTETREKSREVDFVVVKRKRDERLAN